MIGASARSNLSNIVLYFAIGIGMLLLIAVVSGEFASAFSSPALMNAMGSWILIPGLLLVFLVAWGLRFFGGEES